MPLPARTAQTAGFKLRSADEKKHATTREALALYGAALAALYDPAAAAAVRVRL